METIFMMLSSALRMSLEKRQVLRFRDQFHRLHQRWLLDLARDYLFADGETLHLLSGEWLQQCHQLIRSAITQPFVLSIGTSSITGMRS